jgi:hypothetical protein
MIGHGDVHQVQVEETLADFLTSLWSLRCCLHDIAVCGENASDDVPDRRDVVGHQNGRRAFEQMCDFEGLLRSKLGRRSESFPPSARVSP